MGVTPAASVDGVNQPSSSPLLSDRSGVARYGHFDNPVGPIRAGDHALRSPMGGVVTDAERDAAFRSFQFMGAVGENMAAGCAVTHTIHGASAFAYLWADGVFTQLRLADRDGDTVAFAADPDYGTTVLSTGRGSVHMEADGSKKKLRVSSPDLSIELEFEDESVLRLCTPTGPTGWAYVQKVAAVPAFGSATTATASVDFTAADALAHHDYTTGFLRSETWWHWACVAARLPDGRRLGVNVSCGTNESGFRENGAWLDGQWLELGGALFDFDADQTEEPWEITGTDGRFGLRFNAGHGYHARHESDALSTNFHQLFGSFEGWITTINGERIGFTAAPGFTESQYLRW